MSHGSYNVKLLHTVNLSFSVGVKKIQSRDIQRDGS